MSEHSNEFLRRKGHVSHLLRCARGGRGVHSPLDRLREAASSEHGGIIWTDRSAQNWG